LTLGQNKAEEAAMKSFAERKMELRWTIERWLKNITQPFRSNRATKLNDKPSIPMSLEVYQVAQQLTYKISFYADKHEA
jgi:hypothetical protein